LKLYAKDLSFLVKWNFLPKIKEESQSIVALELKNHWKGLVESHSLTQDTRKSVQLPREVSLCNGYGTGHALLITVHLGGTKDRSR
jgi:hypothetical protein